MIIEANHPEVFKPMDDPHRYKILYGGRGSGKSWFAARKLLLNGVRKKIRVLCTRELQKSIHHSVHALLKMQISQMGMGEFYTVTKDAIRGANGTEFIFLGLKMNTEEIKSLEGVDIAWIEEAHGLTEASWDLIDPTIRREGSEIWCTYNTRFKFDTVHKIFVVNKPPPDSLVIKVNHNQNPHFTGVLRKQMEHMKEMDYEKYLHVWEGELKQLAEGAIFGKQVQTLLKDGRRRHVPIQSNCEVFSFWDIGKNDETAIWFMQQVGQEYRFIDYLQARLEEVEYYTKQVKALGYNYGKHYLPHDANHERLGMKRNIKRQLMDGGIRPVRVVPRIAHKETAIELAREVLSKCWFHKGDDERGQRVEKGFETLCNYRYKYKEGDDVFHQTPHHDWASNGADAFQQFAQGYIDNRNTSKPRVKRTIRQRRRLHAI